VLLQRGSARRRPPHVCRERTSTREEAAERPCRERAGPLHALHIEPWSHTEVSAESGPLCKSTPHVPCHPQPPSPPGRAVVRLLWLQRFARMKPEGGIVVNGTLSAMDQQLNRTPAADSLPLSDLDQQLNRTPAADSLRVRFSC
jgi:hypothetical protein